MKNLIRGFMWWLFKKRVKEFRVAVQFTDIQVSNMRNYKKIEGPIIEKNVAEAIARMLISGGFVKITSEKVFGGRSYTGSLRVIK